MLSRSASVARTTLPCGSWARTPNQMASGAYQTSTAVESSAGRPSTGRYCEKPVSVAARLHTGSSSTPSIFASASNRGMCTSSCLAVPEYVEPGSGEPWRTRSRANMGRKYAWCVVRGTIRKLRDQAARTGAYEPSATTSHAPRTLWCSRLFVSQRVNRIETRRPAGRPDAEEQPDRGAEDEGEENRER